jgi:hypothetical protein
VHVGLAPLHTSLVHSFVSAVHAVPAVMNASLGQNAELPVQRSATSHSPFCGRHTNVAG